MPVWTSIPCSASVVFTPTRVFPKEHVEWLQWAFQKAYCQESYQKFNESKFMTLIESFRDTAGSQDLIKTTVMQYRDVYKEMGLEVK